MYLSRSKGRTLLIKVQLTSYEVYLSRSKGRTLLIKVQLTSYEVYLSRSKGRTLLIKVQLTSYEAYLSSRAKVSCLNSALLAALTKISSTSSFALPHHITTRVPRSPCNMVGRVSARSSGYRRSKDKFCFTCQHVLHTYTHN